MEPSSSYHLASSTQNELFFKVVFWATILYAAALTLMLLYPYPWLLTRGWQPTGHIIMYEHIIAFSPLGFLAELARRRTDFSSCLLILVLYALATEVIQETLIPFRTFQWNDLLQDMIGLFCGMAVACLGKFLFHRVFHRRADPL